MKAIKGNKAYVVDEATKDVYLKDGFDITSDDGALIEEAKGKTVSAEKYKEALIEISSLKAIIKDYENRPPDFATMSVEALKAYADTNGIDIGKLTAADKIIEKIKEHEAQESGE